MKTSLAFTLLTTEMLCTCSLKDLAFLPSGIMRLETTGAPNSAARDRF